MRKDRSRGMEYDPKIWKTRAQLESEIETLSSGLSEDAKHLERLRATLKDWDEQPSAKKKASSKRNIGDLVRAIISLSYKSSECVERGVDEDRLIRCLAGIRRSARSIAVVVDEPLEEQYMRSDCNPETEWRQCL